ncbi:hypothetical protein QJS10_CPA03g00515 [Acorus calamus]|uniref:Ribosomal protein L34Ae n=1 Tax=Acorus calamus TaxID=4465 RepID=A0AAV9F322_ACOCL|nr:hypothetical protein QJS10_CPA03g00515 [Acorus calamus]
MNKAPLALLEVFIHGNHTASTLLQGEGLMFYIHASTFFLLLYISSILLINLLRSLYIRSSPPTLLNDDIDVLIEDHIEEVDYELFKDKQEEDLLVEDVVLGEEALLFSSNCDPLLAHEGKEDSSNVSEYASPESSPMEVDVPETMLESSSVAKHIDFKEQPLDRSPTISRPNISHVIDKESEEIIFSKDDKSFFIINPSQKENKKSLECQEVIEQDETFTDSFTVGSTSKSSCEWRSSIRDSETEDPFSSSRRSSSLWETYTMFRKYDEEMMFFDRVSAQKLSETESFRSIQYKPRSMSERIVYKLSSKNKRIREQIRTPYQELEAAYVAQVCLTWEALNWNYKNFQKTRVATIHGSEDDFGCPAQIAQQFQQFQVLLQRFIENEPYERGRRPDIYAQARISAPNLLQVPEFRGDDTNKENMGARVTSLEFHMIIKDAIRTFMNFLKADKDRHCRIFRVFMKKRQSSVDPKHLYLIKKANEKKKLKLKDLQRRRMHFGKKKLKEEEEMEIQMGLIDLKVVSRVLRMANISEEQLLWCEEKMDKVRVLQGKIQRDSTPLFCPVH